MTAEVPRDDEHQEAADDTQEAPGNADHDVVRAIPGQELFRGRADNAFTRTRRKMTSRRRP